MQTLLLEPGDLLQIKSTDLPPGNKIKLQAQSTSFLDISDPKAVLENAFRNFSCLTKGDVFTFYYNDQIYEMAVLEAWPETPQKAISVLETDLSVDFAAPVGFEEPARASGTSTPASALPKSGTVHSRGTMAQSINYQNIAPDSTEAADGARASTSKFLGSGHRLNPKKNATPKSATPVSGTSANAPQAAVPNRRTNGPQPLRLPPGKLFFGYDIKPLQKRDADGNVEEPAEQPKFSGAGQTLRAKKKGSGLGSTPLSGSDAEGKGKSNPR